MPPPQLPPQKSQDEGFAVSLGRPVSPFLTEFFLLALLLPISSFWVCPSNSPEDRKVEFLPHQYSCMRCHLWLWGMGAHMCQHLCSTSLVPCQLVAMRTWAPGGQLLLFATCSGLAPKSCILFFLNSFNIRVPSNHFKSHHLVTFNILKKVVHHYHFFQNIFITPEINPTPLVVPPGLPITSQSLAP